MTTLLKTRSIVTHFYEVATGAVHNDHYKVWGADATGWYVEKITVRGEHVMTVTMVMTLAEAEMFMRGEVMA